LPLCTPESAHNVVLRGTVTDCGAETVFLLVERESYAQPTARQIKLCVGGDVSLDPSQVNARVLPRRRSIASRVEQPSFEVLCAIMPEPTFIEELGRMKKPTNKKVAKKAKRKVAAKPRAKSVKV
jgi:hypothetical protein